MIDNQDGKTPNEIKNDNPKTNKANDITGRFKQFIENTSQTNRNKGPRRKRTTDELVPLSEISNDTANHEQNADLKAEPMHGNNQNDSGGNDKSTNDNEANTNVDNKGNEANNMTKNGSSLNVTLNNEQHEKREHKDHNDVRDEYSSKNTSKYCTSNNSMRSERHRALNKTNNSSDASKFSRSSYISAIDAERNAKKKDKKKIITAVAVGVAVAFALSGICYVVNANSYEDSFLPNTRINGTSVAGLTVNEAFEKAGSSLSQAKTTIIDKDNEIVITGSDIDMKLNENDIRSLKDSQSKWNWISAMIGSGADVSVGTTYDAAKLERSIESLDCVSGKTRVDPVDSKVIFDTQSDMFIATDSHDGDRVDNEAILSAATQCVENGGGVIKTSDFFESPKYTKDSPEIVDAVNTANRYIDKTIFFNIDGIDNAEKLTKSELCGMINVDSNINVNINETVINTWLKEIGKKYDTAGTERTYTTVWGKTTTIPAGESTFGWTTDEASMLPIIIDDIKSDKKEITQDFAYTQKADGPKGGAEWGAYYVDIDKTDQIVRVVKDGSVIFEAETVTGTNTPEKDTPCGIWTVLDKQTNYTMVGEIDPATGEPEYKTPCDYWIRFTWSGCGFHDAEWRARWGTREWLNGNGSHGCANMHLSDVKQLYSLVSVGTPVIIHN